MQSIPAAMTWELFARGRWALPAAAFGVFLFPAIVFTAMEQDGSLNADDPSMLAMCIVMLQMNIFAFGAAIISAQKPMARLYAYPASTATLVAWRLLPAMAAIAVESVAWTAAVNAMFELNWPLWGPALFAAAGLAAVEAAVWWTEKSTWVVAALALVTVAFGLWFKSRHGSMFGEPLKLWLEVTPAEILSMFAVAIAAYWLAVKAVARNRRGEPPISLGIVAWFDRVFDRAPGMAAPFRSPAGAQFWSVWQQKGWIMPAGVVFGLIALVIGWSFSSRDADELVDAFFIGGGILSMLGFIGGLCFGVTGPSDGDFAMGQFLATRPMTTADMARTILRAALRSLVVAWLIWAATFLIVYGILVAFGAVLFAELPKGLGWWYFPATILGAWSVMGCCLSLGLAGRSRLFFQLLVGPISAYIMIVVAAKFLFRPEILEQLANGLAAAVGIALVLGTILAFAAARRRSLIEWPIVWGAGGAWVVAMALVEQRLFTHGMGPWQSNVLLAGLLALVVAPLATAPLALAWNRNR